jgi:hypothetical protein
LKKLKIEDVAVPTKYGWEWTPAFLQTHTEKQIRKLKEEFKEDGLNPTVGINAILDLYKRVAKLEKRK